jgi:hypothetical protein
MWTMRPCRSSPSRWRPAEAGTSHPGGRETEDPAKRPPCIRTRQVLRRVHTVLPVNAPVRSRRAPRGRHIPRRYARAPCSREFVNPFSTPDCRGAVYRCLHYTPVEAGDGSIVSAPKDCCLLRRTQLCPPAAARKPGSWAKEAATHCAKNRGRGHRSRQRIARKTGAGAQEPAAHCAKNRGRGTGAGSALREKPGPGHRSRQRIA